MKEEETVNHSPTVLAAPRGMIPSRPLKLVGVNLPCLLGEEFNGDVEGPASFEKETERIELDMKDVEVGRGWKDGVGIDFSVVFKFVRVKSEAGVSWVVEQARRRSRYRSLKHSRVSRWMWNVRRMSRGSS